MRGGKASQVLHYPKGGERAGKVLAMLIKRGAKGFRVVLMWVLRSFSHAEGSGVGGAAESFQPPPPISKGVTQKV